MMANLPAVKDMAANPLALTAKPGDPAAAGEGVDFSALMANAQSGTGDAPVQLLTNMAAPSVPMTEAASGAAGAVIEGSVVPPVITAPVVTENMTSVGDMATGEMPVPVKPVEGKEKGPKIPNPAKLAQSASALPQLAMAMMPQDITSTKTAPKSDDAIQSKDDAGITDTPSQAPFADGLALPLLQGLEVPVTTVDGQKAPKQVAAHALSLEALPRNLQQAATLPDNAAVPAQLQAQARIDAFTLAVATPERTAGRGLEQAMVQSSGRVQALALRQEAPAMSPILSMSGDSPVDTAAPSIPAVDMGAGDVDTPAPVAAPVSSLSGVTPPMSANPMPMPMGMAASLQPVAVVADTGAMLGDQVIDMGVDGQWIDRMAKEISDIAAGTGRASFSLNPENLGRLKVDIMQGDTGANVRLTAETDAAVAMLHQGRHQLQQDARLQAVRIHDVQVERGNESSFSARGQSMGQDQAGHQDQSQAFHKKPLIQAVSTMANGQEQDRALVARASSQRARYA
ncbi:flagellar hook-length control protein FliK [Rhizorhapis sp. SPR117]|uniref:flagellar hook-length control protein FliK n=1 Tax=Rhizorhapis sp. SPR117 TaxID=2912611 RepID=UPI001F44D3C5|nr:flagellar hook-length control protein FliK [Rhizorhapis sp. SPR117]